MIKYFCYKRQNSRNYLLNKILTLIELLLKMAAVKKKAVSKDDLRRLMKETKFSVRSKDKKVDHPHAKYP